MCRLFGVSTGGRCAGSLGLQDLPEFGSGPLVACSLLLSALSLCLWCVGFEYGLISRFKAFLAGFGRFVWVYVVLVRCVACGALYACGVRRIKGLLRVCLPFILLPFSFCLSFHLFTCFLSFTLSALLWLSFACPLVLYFLSCFVCSFFFPYGLYAKRKGAIPCVLSSCVVGLFICLAPP